MDDDMDTMTNAQQGFARNLIAARWRGLGAESYEAALTAVPLDRLTKRDGSRLIERLLALPVDPDPSMPEVVAAAPRKGENGSTGTCSSCGHTVERGAGWYYGSRGNWKVHHKAGECKSDPAPAPADLSALKPGPYALPGDRIVWVYETGAKRLAAKEWTGRKFSYVRGVIYEVAAHGVPMTAEQAAAFGHSTGVCVACARSLTDERSVSVGYGPVCAGKYGWPWGDK